MAVEYTEPSRKNVSVQYEAQDSAEVSTTFGGESVKITIPRPDKFKAPTVADAVELDDILEQVDIRFVASTAGYSSGDVVQTWENSGKETGKDLSHPSKLGNRSDVDKPTFDIGGSNNPFTTGAIKFVADATADTHESKFLHFGGVAEDDSNGQRLTIEGEFTMYTVMSFDKAAAKAGMSPLWVYSPTRNSTNPVLTSNLSLRVTLRGDNQTFGDADYVFQGNSLTSTGQSKMSTANGDAIILVISRDSEGNYSVYDFNALGFINEIKGIGSVQTSSEDDIHIDSFGPKCEIRDTSLATGGAASDPGPVANISDGDTVYLAEWGLFRKAIDGQRAASLARLLKEKYQIS